MQLRKYDDEFLLESALSAPRNDSTHHQTFDSPTAPHFPIIAHEMKLLQSQIESLDLSFLEHIVLPDGLFVMQETHKKFRFDIDSDNDDSTADLTDDSDGIDESFDRSPSNSVSLHKSEFKIPTCITAESPSLTKRGRRPTLLSHPPVPRCPSSEAFNSQKSENEKLQIKTVEIERSVKRQSQQRRKSRKVLQINLQRPKDESLVSVMKAEDSHAEQQVSLTEMEAIREQLDANETRIRILTSQRNEEAALSLNLELMIARLGILTPESEQLVLSAAELKSEREELRGRLRLAGIDDATLEASVQQRVKERELESTRIMQELSLRVQELQNDKNELSEQIRSYRTAIENLKASGLELDTHIEMLESVYRPLTKSELEAFEKSAGLPVVTSLLTGRFSRISRIFRRQ